jgi:hypothetical protein
MNDNTWIIWNELVKTDYKINDMTVCINYNRKNFHQNSLEIKIKFDNSKELEKFSNFVFIQYGIDIRVDTFDNSFEIELKNLNSNNKINKNLLENISFPLNVDSIKIINFLINTTDQKTHNKLFNLPENLHQLKIFSLSTSFDLSNLPISLILLDVCECEPKLNLDYLPCGLKVLYLPESPVILKDNFNYSYNLSDLSNLPSSLIEINLGHIIFKSTNDLIKTLKLN